MYNKGDKVVLPPLTMNDFLEDIKIALECAICFERLQQPKSLSCLHTFCLGCLQNWVKKQGQLVCPTCRQSQMIPEGGLQKLYPNIFVNNMLDCFEKVENAGNTKCFCCQQTNTEFYCQQCRISLCSVCVQQHKILPALVSHTLHPMKDIKTMTLQQFSSLHPALCPEHEEPLNYYCTKCETAICIHCTIIKHQNKDGSHHYIDISEAFDKFKQKAAKIEPAVANFINKIENSQKTLKLCLETLTKHKAMCEQEIDQLVEEAIEIVNEHGIKLKENADFIFEQKKRTIESQDNELMTLLKKVTRTQNFISQLMKSDAATAMESCDKAIVKIKKHIENLPDIKQQGNSDVTVCKERTQLFALREKGIGVIKTNDDPFLKNRSDEAAAVKACDKAIAVLDDNDGGVDNNGDDVVDDDPDNDATYRDDHDDDNENRFIAMKTKAKVPVRKEDVTSGREDNFEIASSDPFTVTPGQICKVKIIQNHCVMDSKPLKASLKHSTGAIVDVVVQKINGNDYIAKCYSKNVGVAYVNVYAEGKQIRGSPVHIRVVPGRLATMTNFPDIEPYIWHQKTRVMDIAISGEYIFVAGCSNEVVRFQLCGIYEDRIFLPKGTKVNRMYCIKQSGDLLISDGGKTCVLVHSTSNKNDTLQWNGLREPYGLTMDESKPNELIYVADRKAHCIFIYHLRNRELVKIVGCQGSTNLHHMERPHDVVITKEGNILVADYGNSRLLLLTSGGFPLKQLLKGEIYHPRSILTDKDNNIIVASTSELSVCNNTGKDLKRIIRSTEELEGLTIWPCDQRSIAVADYRNNKIQIFNNY
ncbi:uncharacterized protein LOC117100021 [Anneissia japonica]|uniref:uncharacterized protein LOC117100021 n=1 Tax=Anneissia japonica TaxID=1529436 RepID=UPI001425793A|nr:uncharacterized protein LOC117100021 [Anneissia japonica]